MKGKYKVAVAMSGGVDSTAAAIILKEKGYEVIGLFMKLYDRSFPSVRACFGPDEERIERVERICRILKIPLYVIDLSDKFKKYVIEYFRKEYLSGRTPNPCIRCNSKVKFGFLVEEAKKRLEFEIFSTGHHVRVEKKKGRYLLKKAHDTSKDQSYFLYALSQDQLSFSVFPAGDYLKEDLRKLVASYGIEPIKESQDFISGKSYSILFKKEEMKEGIIVDKGGRVLGRHRGIVNYTIGQRRGLGISSSRPLYVIDIDPEKNRIVVGHKEELFSKGLIAKKVNLVSIPEIRKPIRAMVKIRQQHKEAPATLYPEKDAVKVIFDKPQMAVTPGQSAVFYDGDMVIGGGVIESKI